MSDATCGDCRVKSTMIDELDHQLLEEREAQARRVVSLLRTQETLEQEVDDVTLRWIQSTGEAMSAQKREREWRLNHKQMVDINRRQREKVRSMHWIARAAWDIVNEHKVTQDSESGQVVTIMLDEHIGALASAFAHAAQYDGLVMNDVQ